MLGRSQITKQTEEDREPLLADDDHDRPDSNVNRASNVIFSADDDDDEEHGALSRGSEDDDGSLEVYPRGGPPLRSTVQSREARACRFSETAVVTAN